MTDQPVCAGTRLRASATASTESRRGLSLLCSLCLCWGRPVFSSCSLFGTAVFMSGESVSSGKEPWGTTGWGTCPRLLVSKAEALPPLIPASCHVDKDVSHHPEVSEGIPGRADHDHDLPSQTESPDYDFFNSSFPCGCLWLFHSP